MGFIILGTTLGTDSCVVEMIESRVDSTVSKINDFFF
jgi:hypothetical protein